MADLAVWQRTIVDEEGNVIPGAEIEVRREDDGSLATLYADRAGETPLANPLSADMSGFVRFFAQGDAYTITAVGVGSTRTWRFDPTGRLQEFDRISDALAVDGGADTAEARSLLGTFSTVAEVQSRHIPAVLESIMTLGRDALGDGGGGPLHEGQPSDPGAIQSGDGRWWRPEPEKGQFSTKQFASVQDSIDATMAADIVRIWVPDDMPTVPNTTNRSNVYFRGPGSFPGTNNDTGIYRRQVVPDPAPAARAAPDLCNLRINKPGPINVVLVGDSLGTYAADTISAMDGLAVRLEAKLRRDNPDRQINFYSRSIGGQRYTDLDDLPNVNYTLSDRYPWYTDDQRPWLDYVDDLAPDLVFLSFGMNDHTFFDRTALESVVSKLESMDSAPQIALITNMVPNLSPHPDNSTYGAFQSQEGRDYVAGWVRSYAIYHGYPLIDINRTFNMVRDGRDILNCHLVKQDEVIFGSPSEYTAGTGQRCREFSIRASIHPDGWTNAQPIAVTLNGTATNNVVFIDDVGGFLRFRFFRGDAGSLYNTVQSDIPTPSTEVEVEIGVRATSFSFRVLPSIAANAAGVAALTVPIIRYGGLTRPRIAYSAGGGGPVTRATLWMGIEQPVVPTATDLELWGSVDTASGATRENGGNGINHLTSAGAAAIYGEHFSRQIYRIEQFTVADQYSIGQIIFAQVDGTGVIGFGSTVDGSRLMPSNADAATPPSQSPSLPGTTWRLLGAVTGDTAAQRTALWERVG